MHKQCAVQVGRPCMHGENQLASHRAVATPPKVWFILVASTPGCKTSGSKASSRLDLRSLRVLKAGVEAVFAEAASELAGAACFS